MTNQVTRVHSFRNLTEVLRDSHQRFYGEAPNSEVYSRLIRRINNGLFGIETFGHNRKRNMTVEQQEICRDFEIFLIRRSNRYHLLEPQSLIDQVLSEFI